HANDGEFPRLPATTGVFSDEERRSLLAAGLPVDDRDPALARERALWQAVTAGDRVCISYRTTDAQGTPLLPSLLVPPGSEQLELPRRDDFLDEPVNAEEDARGAARRLSQQLAQRETIPIDTPDPAALRRAIVNAYAEHMRGAPDRTAASVNPWNGQLRDPLVLAHLAEKYNDQHVWSASQVEAYTTVPFVFLLERVLGLKQIEEADEDTDRLTSGSVKHAVLERFYNQYEGLTPPEFGPDLRQALVDICADVFKEWQRSGAWLGMPALWEQHRLGVLEMLDQFIEWDLAQMRRRNLVVWRCEHEIGNGSAVELMGRNRAGREVRMRLRGRIDRIDQDRAGHLTVIDYKSSTTPQGEDGYLDGSVLQGPLYVAALRAQGHDATRSVYRSLKKRTNGAECKYGGDAYEAAVQVAFSVPERVRRGLFEAVTASAQEWKDYHPGLAVRRTHAQLEAGSRFDG
ncbi:MAG TPA: PD-(D/E)XK nuclease family protein, partial [Longimicrobiales bacterium]|nr:PD-(D/E)XK nuclease family protein [Longimicrobiales bacterium]